MSSKPECFSTLTSVIIVDGAQKTIDSLQKALGAEVDCVMNCPDSGKVMHGSLRLGESTLFVSDECKEMGMHATGRQQFYLYVDNVDQSFEKAKGAGWSETEPLQDMFWGDRVGAVQDGNGNTWKLAQKVRDVTPEEMAEAMKSFAKAG